LHTDCLMKRLLALLVGGLLLLAACTAGTDAVDQSAGGQYRFIGATPNGKTIPAASRKTAGNVSGELLSGGNFDLAAQQGKIVVRNFCASYCGPRRTESPNFDTIYRSMKGDGVEFVGLDVKEVGRDAPNAFVHDFKITYPSVWDPKAKTALQLGKLPVSTAGLPWTAIVDRQQRVAAVYVGEVLPADVKPALTSLLAES
jgi:thiol-disulfide isomerase/thioredoxin